MRKNYQVPECHVTVFSHESTMDEVFLSKENQTLMDGVGELFGGMDSVMNLDLF